MKIFKLLLVQIFWFTIANAQSKNFIDQPYIEVHGSADTMVTPDEIYISIHLDEKDVKDRITLEEMETKMLTTLKSIGIDTDKEISTNDMGSHYKLYILKKKDIIKSRNYILKVKDATTAAKVFTALEEINISNTSISRVEHSMAKQIRHQMRSKAVADAKDRATSLTTPLNQQTGNAIHIADNEVNSVNSMLPGRDQNLNEVVVVGYSSTNKFKDQPDITFEKIKIAANINVKFVLLPGNSK